MVPTVSVIVPVYNAQQTLERCVESVLAQSFCDWELILIDDGSLDDSGSLCDAYAVECSRVQVLHQENGGVSAARNAGIAIAKGEYLFFLDCDDYIERDMLERYITNARANSADIVIGGLRLIGNQTDGDKLPVEEGLFGTEIFEKICADTSTFGYVGGKMVRTAIVQANDIWFRTDMQSQEDLEFFLSIYPYCEKFSMIRYAGYCYEYVPSKRVPPVWDFIANQLKLLHVAGKVVILSEDARACVKERIVTLLFSCLHDAVERKEYDTAYRKLQGVDGLQDYLLTIEGKGERYRIATWFAHTRYRLIYWYFSCRIMARRIVRVGR